MPERWFQISLQLRAQDVDAASGLLAAAGHSACEIVDCSERSELRLFVRCDSLVEAREQVREIERVLARFAAGHAELVEIDERIWREDWKRHFKPVRIGKRLEIVPPWEAPPQPAHALDMSARDGSAAGDATACPITIVINPGLAFGTGQHETTAGCLQLLERRLRRGESVLDVGCGSAVLAIAAARLGAGRVLAIDNDPEAVNAARENTVLNAVQDFVEVRLGDGPPAAETFDLVLANILAAALLAMAGEITSCVNPDGVLVLSGIESEQIALLEVGFGGHGWRVTETIERAGWVSLALARHTGEEGSGR